MSQYQTCLIESNEFKYKKCPIAPVVVCSEHTRIVVVSSSIYQYNATQVHNHPDFHLTVSIRQTHIFTSVGWSMGTYSMFISTQRSDMQICRCIEPYSQSEGGLIQKSTDTVTRILIHVS